MTGIGETAAELESIARHLRLAGELGLRQELLRAVSGAARDVGPEIRASLGDHMPSAYAEVLDADLAISTSTRLTGDDPQVSLIGRPRARRRALARLEGGVLGHPVYGMRSRFNPGRWAAWVDQADGVTAGFFAGPAERAAPRVREAIEKALATVAEKAARKGP